MQDWKSEDTRLAERLQKLKLDMFVMEGDGNCQVCKPLNVEFYQTLECFILLPN